MALALYRKYRPATFADVMQAMAAATIAALPDRSAVAVGRLTGLAYALEHPDLRRRVLLAHLCAGRGSFGPPRLPASVWLLAHRRALPNERRLLR